MTLDRWNLGEMLYVTQLIGLVKFLSNQHHDAGSCFGDVCH